MSALIFYLFLALFVSFICSLTESVLLSTPQTFLITIKEKEKWAKRIECGMIRPDMDAISASKIHPPPRECRVIPKKRKNETFEIPDCRPALARRKK